MKQRQTLWLAAVLTLVLTGTGLRSQAQITVADNQTAVQLVQALSGAGVVVINPSLTCPGISNGKFTVTGTSNLGIDSGIVLTSGRAMTAGTQEGVNGASTGPGPSAGTSGPSTDAQLSSLVTQPINDLCKLEFDFVPAGDSIKFDYVFASSEYSGFSCSQFNDVFGFFITGPGFPTAGNLAIIPGTNIPITFNSTTSVTPLGGVNPCNDGTCNSCTSMGPGSPFSTYYIDNTGGASVTYQGFTKVFTAKARVNPCDTYHLKLAIADCTDNTLDSGVFLKAGSLSSTSLKIKAFGGGGLEAPFTNTVRGCPPGVIRISRNRNSNLSQPLTIPLNISGTAVNGVDYVTLPGSVTMPAGDSVVTLNVQGIPLNPPVGPKTVIISVLSPYPCTNGPLILDTDTITILDSIYVDIVTPDTAICRGRFVDLIVQADTQLEFSWTPAATVSNPTGQNVRVTPTAPTIYTVSVNLPRNSGGCHPSTASIFIDVKDTPIVNLGPDKITCDTASLYAATNLQSPQETFTWTPATGLSNTSIRNPLATLTTSMEYIVKVNPGAVGCDGYDTIKVRLLPDTIGIRNKDTIVCAGTPIPLRVDGDTAFSYHWTPEQNIADPLKANTTLTAFNSGYYTLTAAYPWCIRADSFFVEVQPVPQVNIGPDKVICTYDTIQLFAAVTPAYPNYAFDWTPGDNMTDSTAQTPVFYGDVSLPVLTVNVTTPIGCKGTDSMSIIVYPGDFLSVLPGDTGACPPATIQLGADGADTYAWSPAFGLDATNIANPVASPVSTTQYTLLGTKNYNSHTCYDTQLVMVRVYPNATISIPDSVQIWPGESYQMDPGGNCLYFSWFPPSGLTADNISNPKAQPEVRTRYFVTATTEEGCIVKDSIDVLVNTESVLDVPNAFSPSTGDFKIVKRGIAHLKYFRIFNRWGNKVFETTDIEQGWNGRFKDKEQPLGVYIYSIEATTSTGKPFKKDGNLTLIR